ncbi:hypothetical protein GCM10009601_19590 [Streptomyces thermospinosisporus]|uniref:Uncharacterized protein n=1 Tax=Streptomyces thermospinosisporus TaxID=161482 RepID=A0ABN1YVL5_9ACTN
MPPERAADQFTAGRGDLVLSRGAYQVPLVGARLLRYSTGHAAHPAVRVRGNDEGRRTRAVRRPTFHVKRRGVSRETLKPGEGRSSGLFVGPASEEPAAAVAITSVVPSGKGLGGIR